MTTPTLSPDLAVECAMDPTAARRALDQFVELNPQLRGIKLADVLDMLRDVDAWLDLTEPVYEALCDSATDDERDLIVPATLALLYATPAGDGAPGLDPAVVHVDDVRELVTRARRYREAAHLVGSPVPILPVDHAVELAPVSMVAVEARTWLCALGWFRRTSSTPEALDRLAVQFCQQAETERVTAGRLLLDYTTTAGIVPGSIEP